MGAIRILQPMAFASRIEVLACRLEGRWGALARFVDVDAVFSWLKSLGGECYAHPIWGLRKHSGPDQVVLRIPQLRRNPSGLEGGDNHDYHDYHPEYRNGCLNGSISTRWILPSPVALASPFVAISEQK